MNMDKQETLDQLSAYPHIQRNVDRMWGDESLALYLGKLLLDVYRDASIRRGFPRDIAFLLMKVYDEHTTVDPDSISYHIELHGSK